MNDIHIIFEEAKRMCVCVYIYIYIEREREREKERERAGEHCCTTEIDTTL